MKFQFPPSMVKDVRGPFIGVSLATRQKLTKGDKPHMYLRHPDGEYAICRLGPLSWLCPGVVMTGSKADMFKGLEFIDHNEKLLKTGRHRHV